MESWTRESNTSETQRLSTGTRVPYSLIRFKRFFFNLLHNRKAAVGITLLSFFVFTAIAGPLLTPGAGIVGYSVNATLYIDRYVAGIRDARWNIWSKAISSTASVEVPLDSISGDLKDRLGISTGNIDPAELIFSRPADFTYTLELTLPPNLSTDFSVQNFIFQI